MAAADTISAAVPPQHGGGKAGAGLGLGACIALVVGTMIGAGPALRAGTESADRPRQTSD